MPKLLDTLISDDLKVGVITPKQGWEINTLYKVRMAWTEQNPVHFAILITDAAFNPKRMTGTIWNPQTGCIPFQPEISYLEVEYEIDANEIFGLPQ